MTFDRLFQQVTGSSHWRCPRKRPTRVTCKRWPTAWTARPTARCRPLPDCGWSGRYATWSYRRPANSTSRAKRVSFRFRAFSQKEQLVRLKGGQYDIVFIATKFGGGGPVRNWRHKTRTRPFECKTHVKRIDELYAIWSDNRLRGMRRGRPTWNGEKSN